MIQELKEIVVEANKELLKRKVVIYSWGNVSAIDRNKGIIVIKPVGLPYDELTTENISVVDLEGKPVRGEKNPLKPSVDLDIHRALYENFQECQAVVHTHSTYATVMAQLHHEIPCFGTTHADYFAGTIPCVDLLTDDEVINDYEWNTGMAIVKYFRTHNINPEEIPAALSINHGPFTWGEDAWDAVHKAVVLEEICKMAVHMLEINPDCTAIPKVISDKHFFRKHGVNAYFMNDDHGHGMIHNK
ncbi:MAG: L-ribulose-5-phosphate 4-epimerase AraD [Lachnospiraceae bacterium]|nr:L-ribulose-5-phosphate 4-epimerase AraD [Lachnospiraceae bacterium]